MAAATVEADEPQEGAWPVAANPDLPMGGLFYGHPLMGEQTGNGILFGYEASRRFRAERSGLITAVRHNNRTLIQRNIDGRCKDDNIWCACKEGDLDRFTCGYHLANSYSLGNGGLVTIEIHADDESDQHLPSGTALGAIVAPYVPLEIAVQVYPVFELETPVQVEAGQIYHLVYRQLNPPTRCTRRGGYTVAEAAECDKDSGLIGLNGIWFSPSQDRGPWLGETAAILTRHSAAEGWTLDPDNLSWFEIRYSDGVWTGDAYTYNDGAATAQLIGGDNQIRQRFTVGDVARSVDGVWLRAGRRPGGGEGVLSVAVAEDGKEIKARGRFAPEDFRECAGGCGSWAYAPLDRAIVLELGRDYLVTFAAPAGAVYAATSGFPLDYAPYESQTRNNWENAGAQFSADGGITWKPFSGAYRPNRDLSLLFTVVGMPRSLTEARSVESAVEAHSWGRIKAGFR